MSVRDLSTAGGGSKLNLDRNLHFVSRDMCRVHEWPRDSDTMNQE